MAALLDNLDAKVRALLFESESEEETSIVHHTFTQRAESYYQKRPHLLSLLRQLHSAYISLLSNHHRHHQKLILPFETDDDTTTTTGSPSSSINGGDGSSSISFSNISSSSMTTASSHYFSWPLNEGVKNCDGGRDDDGVVLDALVTEMVMKGVETEMYLHELSVNRTRVELSERRCELQRRLVEVLESERVMLGRDNVRMRWKVAVLAEERKVLSEEEVYLRRRVTELTGSLMRVKKEEGRMTVELRKRIEELQREIYGLEKLNKSVMKERREEVGLCCNGCGKRGGGGVEGGDRRRMIKWWERVKGHVFLCAP